MQGPDGAPLPVSLICDGAYLLASPTTMRSPFPAAVPLAFALLLVPRLSSASENLGVLAVAEPPGPAPELVEATSQFRRALAERTPGVLDASELRLRMAGQTPTASLSEVDRALAGAVATYQAGDYDGAIRTLRAVIEDIERLPDSPEAFAQWTRAMLRLARAEQTVGQRAELQATLERLVRADPQVKVDLTQYPPSFAEHVDAARSRVAALPQRRLTVTSAQKGVTVYVNGRQVGAAPVTVTLPSGKHRISGALKDLRVPGVTADLSQADQVVPLDLALAQALRPDAGPGLALVRGDRSRDIVAAAAWLGLDRVIATSTVAEGDVTYLQGTLFEVRRGVLHREARLRLTGGAPPPGGLAALAAFLMTGQPSALVAGTSTPPPPAAPARAADLAAAPPPASLGAHELGVEARPRSRLLKWSPVAGAGLAVGLGAVAAWSALKADDEYSAANGMLASGTLRPGASPEEYNAHISDGNSARRLAAGAGIGAATALAASAVLGYLSYRDSGEIGPFRF